MTVLLPEHRGSGRVWTLDLALTVPALLIVCGWLLLAAMHLNDHYEVGHGQGVWMALARHANTAGLYPAVVGGDSYGGSRYMPLPILLHAGMARVTGEYLVSGKLAGLFATFALLVTVFLVLRRLGCRWSWALALTASVMGGFAGLRAGTTIGGDALPVVFGVAAVGLLLRQRSPTALVAAGVLAALGVSAKLTALWAPVAIATWLSVIDRRRAAMFVAFAAAATVVLLGALNLASDGRMLENLAVTWGAGFHGSTGLLKAPARLLGYLIAGEWTTWALIPVLLVTTASSHRHCLATPLLLSWLAAACLLVPIYADVGTGPNQLIDLAVLTVLVAGAAIGAANRDGARDRLLIGLVAAIVIWSSVSAVVVRIRPPLQETIGAALDGRKPYRRDLLTAQVPPGHVVLSEDPGVLVELGQTPIVFDAFMLRRLADRHPAAVAPLIERVERQDFDLIVLVVRLERADDVWWRDYHFGPRLARAVDRAYAFDRKVGRYHLYRRRP